MSARLVMAFADPPYIGQAEKHYGDHPDFGGEVDHQQLLARLVADFPDGWALCLSTPSLHVVLDHCREQGLSVEAGDVRVLAWVKPFAAYKRSVRVGYAWEPVIVKPARRLDGAIVSRDWFAESIVMKAGLAGAKPERLCHWLFGVMGLRPGDELHDLFPGSGAVTDAWRSWDGTSKHKLTPTQQLVEMRAWLAEHEPQAHARWLASRDRPILEAA